MAARLRDLRLWVVVVALVGAAIIVPSSALTQVLVVLLTWLGCELCQCVATWMKQP